MQWGERNRSNSVAAILAAIEEGVNFFDTAPAYGNGESEILLGDVLAENKLREKVVIANKVHPNKMKPAEIQTECEDSLRRLKTDYLDLYQTHWSSREVPLEESWGAMQRLQEQGKVRHIGVCNMGVNDLEEVIPIQKPLTNQLPYNLFWRMIESTIIPKCVDEGIGILAYSPLMHGILADKYQSADEVPDGRARSRHFSSTRELTRHSEPGCEHETFEALDAIRKICKDIDRKMAGVALNWIVQQTSVVSVIAGAGNAQQVRDNVRMLDTELPEDVISQLNNATDTLKEILGSNPDMWDDAKNSRYR